MTLSIRSPAIVDSQTSRRRWASLFVVCVAALIINIDNTILNVALPTLVRDLRATSSELQWIVDSYAMVFAGLLFVGGSLADRFGRRRFFLIGLTVFAAGSIGAAFSGSVHVLIACRGLMGAGAALTIPASLSIINDSFRDSTERARAIGAWAGTVGLGIAVGPIAGGLLLSHFWWGSIFLVNVPIACFGLVGAVILVRESKNPHVNRPDPVGAVLSIAGLGLLLWSIIEGPTHGWSSAIVLGVGFASLVALAGFVAWESRCTHPMLNLKFFRDRSFSVALAAECLGVFGLMGALFLSTQFLQFRSRALTLGGRDSHSPDSCHGDRERGGFPGRCSPHWSKVHSRRWPVADHRRLMAGLGDVGIRDDIWRCRSRSCVDRFWSGVDAADRYELGDRIGAPG